MSFKFWKLNFAKRKKVDNDSRWGKLGPFLKSLGQEHESTTRKAIRTVFMTRGCFLGWLYVICELEIHALIVSPTASELSAPCICRLYAYNNAYLVIVFAWMVDDTFALCILPLTKDNKLKNSILQGLRFIVPYLRMHEIYKVSQLYLIVYRYVTRCTIKRLVDPINEVTL